MPHTEYWPFVTNVDFNGEPSILQKQLGMMEGEVKEIQMELAAIKKDRMDFHVRKQNPLVAEPDEVVTDNTAPKDSISRFPDDELLKVPQTAKLREQLIRAKNAADEERFLREKYEARLRDLEAKLNNICYAGVVPEKESQKNTNEEILALKNQVRDLNEEIEELKISAAEKCEQLEEYRAKYLQAQQQVEELRRQMEVIEFDNRQVSDQIQVEIQKMKMHFQAKLQELAPLPELLQGARAQLHEARQLQALAEDSARHLTTEIHLVNEKLVAAVNSLNQERADKLKLLEETQCLKLTTDGQRIEIEQLFRNIDDFKQARLEPDMPPVRNKYRAPAPPPYTFTYNNPAGPESYNECQILRLEEKLSQLEARYKDKSTECSHLLQDLEEQRIQGSRALNRAKERADSMRRYMQTQVSELERQLIQSRAQCRACQKERDETRQRMQIQINNLQESFELAEIRLSALRSQVTSLKNSYSLILANEEHSADSNKIDTP